MLLYVLSFAVAMKANTQSYEIRGKIKNAENEKLYLIKSDGSPYYLEGQPIEILDSTIVRKGVFYFKGLIEEKGNVALKIKNGRQKSFVLEPGITYVSGDAHALWKIQITNSKENKLFLDLWNSYHWAADSLNLYADKYNENIQGNKRAKAVADSLKYAYYNKLYDSLRISKTQEFIVSHPGDFVSLSQLNLYVSDFGPDKSKALLFVLKPFFVNHSLYKIIESRIVHLENKTDVGSFFPSFSVPDTSGRMVDVKDLGGDILIVDFWASWCAPCRKENAIYRKIHQEFGGKNISIVSVSLDVNRKNWLKAIRNDKMNWTNLSDLQGMASEKMIRLGINFLPMNFVLDRDRRVIAKNLSGEELYKGRALQEDGIIGAKIVFMIAIHFY